ncbi:MAG: proline--tRNA ligase, partial [Bacteroidales bacterium]|nr:proline--tRNA ligase [Bacteroidales bacterium]
FDVTFTNKENKQEYVWATSWGVSTRLMGALIMTHSDDNGLVLPPKLAPIQVVIVPIYKTADELKAISACVQPWLDAFEAKGISVKFDDADNKKPGWKFSEYELKGIPVRLAIGPRDLENHTLELMRRDTLEKESVPQEGIVEHVVALLDEIQDAIFEKARKMRDGYIRRVDTWDQFKEEIEKGGFLIFHWDGTTETEERIKAETKATIRCIPFVPQDPSDLEPGVDMLTGKPSARRVLFARSY